MFEDFAIIFVGRTCDFPITEKFRYCCISAYRISLSKIRQFKTCKPSLIYPAYFVQVCSELFSESNIYRPHPKDGGRYCFQFVGSHVEVHLSGVPHARSGQGVPHPRFRQGVPHPRSGLNRGYPIQDQDGEYPGVPPSIETVWGTPPQLPCQETDLHSEHLLRGGLRSRRRTFLCKATFKKHPKCFEAWTTLCLATLKQCSDGREELVKCKRVFAVGYSIKQFHKIK